MDQEGVETESQGSNIDQEQIESEAEADWSADYEADGW